MLPRFQGHLCFFLIETMYFSSDIVDMHPFQIHRPIMCWYFKIIRDRLLLSIKLFVLNVPRNYYLTSYIRKVTSLMHWFILSLKDSCKVSLFKVSRCFTYNRSMNLSSSSEEKYISFIKKRKIQGWNHVQPRFVIIIICPAQNKVSNVLLKTFFFITNSLGDN